MFRNFLRPGQGFKTFTVLRQKGGKTAKGRPCSDGELAQVGTITGIFSKTDPAEKGEHKQDSHPITYTIVQHGAAFKAQAHDVLELVEGDTTRRFDVKKKPRDPAGLGHFTIYHVEEREDQ